MPTHHAQTALRYLEKATNEPVIAPEALGTALVHAQLETAAQIERLADGMEAVKKDLDNTFDAVVQWIMSGGIANLIHQT